jgi:hypothetical protein
MTVNLCCLSPFLDVYVDARVFPLFSVRRGSVMSKELGRTALPLLRLLAA